MNTEQIYARITYTRTIIHMYVYERSHNLTYMSEWTVYINIGCLIFAKYNYYATHTYIMCVLACVRLGGYIRRMVFCKYKFGYAGRNEFGHDWMVCCGWVVGCRMVFGWTGFSTNM